MVISGVNTVTYNGDGITTAWPFTFPISSASEIKVQLINTDGTYTAITSDYYVDVVNSTVYYPGYAPGAEPPENEQPPKVQTGQKIEVYRDVPMTQEAYLGEKWPFEVIEKGLDKLTMIAQQIDSGTTRKLDASLASMFQLAGIVTNSGELQHITDQLNDIDNKVEDVQDYADAAEAHANNAATFASNAAGSASSASATATEIAGWLADKETLSAPALDNTLSVSGAAADAEATGERLNQCVLGNCLRLPLSDTSTHNGVTYTWVDGVCTMTGTASSASQFVIFNGTSTNLLPSGMVAGKTYRFSYNTTSSKVQLALVVKSSGGTTSDVYFSATGGDFLYTIPADTVGLRVRFYVANGTSFSPATTIDKIGIYACDFDTEPVYKWDEHGVKEFDLKFTDKTVFTYDNNYLSSTTYAASVPIEIPREGIYVYVDDAVNHNCLFVKKDVGVQGHYVPDTDYPHCYYGTAVETSLSRYASYYPYKAGTYMVVVLGFSNKDKVHAVTGKVTDIGGRLPNLQPNTVWGVYADGTKAKQSIVIRTHLNWNYQRPVWGMGYTGSYPTWETATEYAEGEKIMPSVSNGYCYECVTAGTSGSVEPTWPTDEETSVSDGTCEWVGRKYNSGSYVNGFESYGRFWMSVMRLQDVSKIVVAPPYSVVARIYKIDHDNKTATRYEDIFGSVMYGGSVSWSANISGVSRIDLSQYSFEGFVVIVVVPKITKTSVLSATPPYTYFSIDYSGILNSYQDIYNSVFVEWKAGVGVSYEGGINSIERTNINTIVRNTFAPNLLPGADDGRYSSYISQGSTLKILAMGKCTGWWYNGGTVSNVPFTNITPKSFITASKNRHSRMYAAKQFVNDANNLYGVTCGQAVATLAGRPCSLGTFEAASEWASDMVYRNYTHFDDLRPGDFLVQGNFRDGEQTALTNPDYGHVQFITEKVIINGETFCINAFEGDQPWTRFKTYVNYEAFDGYTTVYKDAYGNVLGQDDYGNTYTGGTEMELFAEASSRNVGGNFTPDRLYSKLARMKPEACHTFRDIYGPYDTQDYSVSTIMCDRGTDSVYGIVENMALTVTDGTTSVDLVVNGNTTTIDLTDYPVTTYTENGVTDKVYDVTGMVTEAGYHEIQVGGITKESFFVPVERTITRTVSENTVTITFEPNEENDTVFAIMAYYKSPDDGDYRSCSFLDFDAETVNGNGLCEYEMPYTRESMASGFTYNLTSLFVIRKTPYGTYWTRQSSDNTLLQKAGHP